MAVTLMAIQDPVSGAWVEHGAVQKAQASGASVFSLGSGSAGVEHVRVVRKGSPAAPQTPEQKPTDSTGLSRSPAEVAEELLKQRASQFKPENVYVEAGGVRARLNPALLNGATPTFGRISNEALAEQLSRYSGLAGTARHTNSSALSSEAGGDINGLLNADEGATLPASGFSAAAVNSHATALRASGLDAGTAVAPLEGAQGTAQALYTAGRVYRRGVVSPHDSTASEIFSSITEDAAAAHATYGQTDSGVYTHAQTVRQNNVTGTVGEKTDKNADPLEPQNALSDAEKAQLRELQQRDREVRSHEQAHMAAGAGLVRGGPTYTTQRGPDGKSYAVGGQVKIDTSSGSTPEQTVQKARQVRSAALAAGDPSGQDQQVAAAAAQMEAEALRAQFNEDSLDGTELSSSGLGETGQAADTGQSDATQSSRSAATKPQSAHNPQGISGPQEISGKLETASQNTGVAEDQFVLKVMHKAGNAYEKVAGRTAPAYYGLSFSRTA